MGNAAGFLRIKVDVMERVKGIEAIPLTLALNA